MKVTPIWLISYPRSRNTLIRTILHHCFELKSGSIYPSSVADVNKGLEKYIGHLEHNEAGKVEFTTGSLPLTKTHESQHNSDKTICILRDGQPSYLSLWGLSGRHLPFEVIIKGQHRFGI